MIVNYFNEDGLYKNCLPIYCLCLVVILYGFNLAIKIIVSLYRTIKITTLSIVINILVSCSTRFKVTETVGSTNTSSDILRAMTKFNVIVYFMWIIVFCPSYGIILLGKIVIIVFIKRTYYYNAIKIMFIMECSFLHWNVIVCFEL